MGWQPVAIFQRVRLAGAGWVSAPHTFDLPPKRPHRFRGGLRVVNPDPPDSPIPSVDIYVQYDPDGRGWRDWDGWYGKNVDPGHGMTPPTYVTWNLPFDAFDPDLRIRTRLRLDWHPLDAYSGVIDVDIAAITTGELADFFPDDGHTVEVLLPEATIYGIFRDPHHEVLGVSGRKPQILCEAALVADLRPGDDVGLYRRDETWTIRRKRPDGTGLVTLDLEEAA